MTSIAEQLQALPFFRDLASTDVRAAAAAWRPVSVAQGQAFWMQGAPVDSLAVLVAGELSAEVDRVEVGRVLAGELCGEASAFVTGSVRNATLRARGACSLLELPSASLRALRWQRSTVYDALLAQALLTLVRRVRATDLRIARVVQGNAPAPARSEPSALARFWKALRPGGPGMVCPPLERLLLKQPGLAESDAATVQAIAAHFVPQAMEEGQVLFLEGEPGAASYVVAEGQVDVLRHVRGDRAERLATLSQGDQFGVNTLVERGARTASCIAASAGWLYRLDAEAYGRMRGLERLVWRESMLAVLASQIRNANAALGRASGSAVGAGSASSAAAKAPAARTTGSARAAGGTGKPGNGDDGFQDLLRASGFLEGLPVRESELESLSVVVTEDVRRNPRTRPR